MALRSGWCRRVASLFGYGSVCCVVSYFIIILELLKLPTACQQWLTLEANQCVDMKVLCGVLNTYLIGWGAFSCIYIAFLCSCCSFNAPLVSSFDLLLIYQFCKVWNLMLCKRRNCSQGKNELNVEVVACFVGVKELCTYLKKYLIDFWWAERLSSVEAEALTRYPCAVFKIRRCTKLKPEELRRS